MKSRILACSVVGLFLLQGMSIADPDTPEATKERPPSVSRVTNGGLLWQRRDNRKERPKALLYFPTLVQGTAVIYNLPGRLGPLCITGQTLADIYSGRITRWSDDHIVATNPKVRLRSARIRLVNRADENGIGWLLRRCMTKASASWAALTGASAHTSWPTGQSVHNEREMIANVQATPYAVGFADFYSVRDQSTPRAAIQNRAGICQVPSFQSLEEAAAAAAPYSQFESNLDAVDSAAPGAYPITGFSGLIIPSYGKADKRTAGIADLVRYILTDGQKLATRSGYVALPPKLVELELQALSLLRPTDASINLSKNLQRNLGCGIYISRIIES